MSQLKALLVRNWLKATWMVSLCHLKLIKYVNPVSLLTVSQEDAVGWGVARMYRFKPVFIDCFCKNLLQNENFC